MSYNFLNSFDNSLDNFNFYNNPDNNPVFDKILLTAPFVVTMDQI